MERDRVETLVLWSEARKLRDAYNKLREEGGFIATPLEGDEAGEWLQDGDFDHALLHFFSVLGLEPDPHDPSTQWPGSLIWRRMEAGRQVPDELSGLIAEHFEIVKPEGWLCGWMVPKERACAAEASDAPKGHHGRP